MTKKLDASLDSQLDDHHIYEGKSNNNSSSKKVDADIVKDDKMVKVCIICCKEILMLVGQKKKKKHAELELKWSCFLYRYFDKRNHWFLVCIYGLQAIKEVLKEDFIGEEEIPSETLLYKNLWLEAEAALCSINYRARFNRMKIEMEQRKSDNVKGWNATSKPAFICFAYSIYFCL